MLAFLLLLVLYIYIYIYIFKGLSSTILGHGEKIASLVPTETIYIYIYIKPKLRENHFRIQIEFQLESNCMPCVLFDF